MDLVRVVASLLCLTLAAVTLCYAAVCAASPFGICRRCAGRGRLGTGRGLRSRACRRCDATGIRIRFGRRLFNDLARVHRDGTR